MVVWMRMTDAVVEYALRLNIVGTWGQFMCTQRSGKSALKGKTVI